MSRVKRGRVRAKKRKFLLLKASGFKWGRKKKIKLAKPAIKKAGVYAYRDRRLKKRNNRQLWQIKINAALREQSLSYSKFIADLKRKDIILDRKVISQLAEKQSEIFKKLIATLK